MSRKSKSLFQFFRKADGAAAVEFAIVLSILLTLIMGIIDFGHAWFLRQIITNASREGARAGVIFQTPGLSSNAIEVIVRDYLKPSGLDSIELTKVVVDGAGGASGTKLKVTVTSTKTWWIINKFVPGLGDEIQMTAETSMRIE